MFERHVVFNAYKNEVFLACYNDNNKNNNNNLYKMSIHSDGLMLRGRSLRLHSITVSPPPSEHTPSGSSFPVHHLLRDRIISTATFPTLMIALERAHNVAT